MFFRYPISDVHIHVFRQEDAFDVIKMADELSYDQYNILSATSLGPRFAADNLLTAWLKIKEPYRCHGFAGFNYPETGAPEAEDLLKQAQDFHALGFDGIKMMDGKPGIRRKIGKPLDDPLYDPMFDYLEQQNWPVLYHVNDPIEFWTWDLMPEWAKAMGDRVFYGNGEYPSKDTIEAEAVHVVEKHPRLRIIFAHFFFIADDLDKAAGYFERFPNLMFDITPGWEMFESFANRYDESREFFRKYADRIIFGTDTISDHWRTTVGNLRRVMETDEYFVSFEENCHGLNLDEKTLRQIYIENYHKFLPAKPATMKVDEIIAYADRLSDRIAVEAPAETPTILAEIKNCRQELERLKD